MKRMLTGLLAAALVVGACGPRQVEVGSPAAESENAVTLYVTNNLSQPVNVYVVSGATEMFAGQVSANSAQQLPVTGVAPGASVVLRARTADGSRTYSRENVLLVGTYNWQVP